MTETLTGVLWDMDGVLVDSGEAPKSSKRFWMAADRAKLVAMTMFCE